MKPAVSKKIKTFTNHHPYVGPAFWILSVQYFIIQIIVAKAWSAPYSLKHHAISDLGNTACGPYFERFVCSPLHNLMNMSFVILGLTITIGSALIYYGFRRTRLSYLGFSFMALAGIGTIFVGAFPENSVGFMHSLGAIMPFIFGNLSMIILGWSLDMPKNLKNFTILFGVISLIALGFLASRNYLTLGFGGMERIVAYPQTFWMIVFGVYVSAHRYRENRSS